MSHPSLCWNWSTRTLCEACSGHLKDAAAFTGACNLPISFCQEAHPQRLPCLCCRLGTIHVTVADRLLNSHFSPHTASACLPKLPSRSLSLAALKYILYVAASLALQQLCLLLSFMSHEANSWAFELSASPRCFRFATFALVFLARAPRCPPVGTLLS